MPAKKTRAEIVAARELKLCQRFAANYVSNGNNASAAYRSIFPRSSPAASTVSGSRWLVKATVQDEIRKLTDEVWKREHMTASEVLGRMARISRKDLSEYYWRPGELDSEGHATAPGTRKPLHELTKAQVESIEGITYKDGIPVYEFASKQQQLTTVAKHLKLLTDKVDVNLITPLDKLIEASYEQPKQ